jgi:O-antigen/teichoic acid export membrane protein
MSGFRRSLALSTVDRYFAVIARFATLLVTARLLSPGEFGVAVLGTAMLGLAGVIREFGGGAYIIQLEEVSAKRLQTVFTISVLLTLPLAAACLWLAEPMAAFYDMPGLADYLRVTCLCLLVGPFGAPIHALLRRNMSFDRIAFIGTTTATVNAVVTIALALAGFSYMSFAWASLASSALYLAICLRWHPPFAVYRPSLTDWRKVIEYGGIESTRGLLYYLQDNLPLAIFGRTLGAAQLGLFQRAATVSSLPFTTLLAGVQPVIQPLLSDQARQGLPLKDSFMWGSSYTAAFLWPACLVMALLAHPIVLVLLGKQWLEVVPLVQILSVSFTFWFPANLTNPTLIAAGGIRDTLVLACITVPATILVQGGASLVSPAAVAWSFFLTGPLFVALALVAVRRRVPFDWNEFAARLKPSATATAMSIVVPVVVVFASGGFVHVSVPGCAFALAGALIGWLIGLNVARHPLAHEVVRVRAKLVELAPPLLSAVAMSSRWTRRI